MKVLKKYWQAITAYAVYGWLWYRTIAAGSRFKKALVHLNKGEIIALGEGLMYGELLVLAIGIGTTLVTLAIAIFNREQRGFYLTVSLFMIFPVVLFLWLSDFLK